MSVPFITSHLNYFIVVFYVPVGLTNFYNSSGEKQISVNLTVLFLGESFKFSFSYIILKGLIL